MSENRILKYTQDDNKFLIAHLGNPKFCLESSSLEGAQDKALRAFEYFHRVQNNQVFKPKAEVRVQTPSYTTMELCA